MARGNGYLPFPCAQSHNVPTIQIKIKNVIICKVNNDIKEEGYQLKISVNSIRIEAKSAVGFFYALQTIRQLLPAEFEGKEKQLNRVA